MTNSPSMSSTPMSRFAASLTLVASLFAAACSSPPAPGAVTSEQLQAVRGAQQKVSVGVPRDAALAAFPAGNKIRLSSAQIGGVEIEEWKVEAFYDDNSKKSRDLFVSFLYFADGKLVDMSDSRIDFRSRPEIVKSWSGSAGAAVP